MYAIFDAPYDSTTIALVEELQQSYINGLHYPLQEAQKQFRSSLAIAQRAMAEQAEDAMITSALLYRPCHMLFTGEYNADRWTSDSLLESGTYDWLSQNFDGVVAESIRLQPHAHRYLASVVGEYYSRLDEQDRIEISKNGGLMSFNTRVAFARGKYFTQSLRLARWVNQVKLAQLDSMDLRHFERILNAILPSVSRAVTLV